MGKINQLVEVLENSYELVVGNLNETQVDHSKHVVQLQREHKKKNVDFDSLALHISNENAYLDLRTYLKHKQNKKVSMAEHGSKFKRLVTCPLMHLEG